MNVANRLSLVRAEKLVASAANTEGSPAVTAAEGVGATAGRAETAATAQDSLVCTL